MKIFPSVLLLALMPVAPSALIAGEPQTGGKNPQPEQAAVQTPAEFAQSQIPQRELKFDASEEERQVPLELVQNFPPLFEQRYVASFQLDVPRKNGKEGPYLGLFPGEFMKQNFLGNCYGVTLYNLIDKDKELPDECMKIFPELEALQRILLLRAQIRILSLKDITQYIPDQESRTMFQQTKPFFFDNLIRDREENTAGQSDSPAMPAPGPGTPPGGGGGMRPLMLGMAPMAYGDDPYGRPGRPGMGARGGSFGSFGPSGNSWPEKYIQVRIYAPTMQDAEKGVKAWLDLYDRGVCYPAILQCRKLNDQFEQTYAKSNKELRKLERSRDEISEELENYKEFQDLDKEAVGSLKTQRRMLAVDLTGIDARLALANKMLSQTDHLKRHEQIESIKIAAEIEQVGLDAKRREMDRLIKGVDDRQAVLQKRSKKAGEIQRASATTTWLKSSIENLENYRQGYLPLPVHEGKVEIRRIKWAAPTEKK
jgi:hypothetical protein